MEIEKVEGYRDLKKVLEKCSWQKFEKFVGKIFEFHDYDVEVSRVFTFEDTKRQYDVIAAKEHHRIVVDCKKWDNKRRIKYGLKKAVDDQIERVARLDIGGKKYPALVLSCNSPIEYHNGVPVVSVQKLNSFLSDFPLNEQHMITL